MVSSEWKTYYRNAQKKYPELKTEWVDVVWAHVEAVDKTDKSKWDDAVKHFLGKV